METSTIRLEEAEIDYVWIGKTGTLVVTAYLLLFGFFVCSNSEFGMTIVFILALVEFLVVGLLWCLVYRFPLMGDKNVIFMNEKGVIVTDKKGRIKHEFKRDLKREIQVGYRIATNWNFHQNTKRRAKFWIGGQYIGTFEECDKVRDLICNSLRGPQSEV